MKRKNMKVQYYRDLKVWQKAFELVKNIYILTQNFYSEGKFGLLIQFRRATVSIQNLSALITNH